MPNEAMYHINIPNEKVLLLHRRKSKQIQKLKTNHGDTESQRKNIKISLQSAAKLLLNEQHKPFSKNNR